METTVQDNRLNLAQLDATAALLVAGGVEFTCMEEALRCVLAVAGKTYGVVYIVPAESVFPDSMEGGTFSRDFEVIQERILGPAFYESDRKDLYLLVVGSAEFLARQASLQAAAAIEHNLSYGKKEILSAEQAVEWLQNPFWQLSGRLRANQAPILATVADLRTERQPKANLVLNVEDTLEDSVEHNRLIQEITRSVYRRIMGGDHEVLWDKGAPSLCRIGEKEGLEVLYCSSGERTLFAYSLFLARVMLNMPAGLCVGFHGTFDRLDAVRQIGAYDCLRQFVAATGANVVVQSAKESLRRLVDMRMRPVIEALGGKVTDYEYSPYPSY